MAADRGEELPERYQQWLREVDLLLDKQERKAFLALEADYQRDAFIERFWKARDPYPATERNEMKDAWYARLEWAKEELGSWTEDRARVYLLNGAPALRQEIPGCHLVLHPLEVWHYPRSERARRDVELLFYERHGGPPPRLWTPRDGYVALFSEPKNILEQRCTAGGIEPGPSALFTKRFSDLDISYECASYLVIQLCGPEYGKLLQNVFYDLEMEEKVSGSVELLLARVQSRPDPEQEEWLATFSARSTDVPADAKPLPVETDVRYPGRRGSRTVVEVVLGVPREEATLADLGPHASFDFVLTGEVLRSDELFESFRYSFGFPEAEAPAVLPLVFRRHLRPGEYTLVFKLEDVHGQKLARREVPLTVPREPTTSGPDEPWVEEARRELQGEDRRAGVVDLRTEATGVVVGLVRFDATVADPDVARVDFSLDGRVVLGRTRPPFSVELDLGDSPRPHVVRATALDESGLELGRDELELNVGENRFAVRIVSPRSGSAVTDMVDVRVELATPDDKRLDRLELYRGEDLVATLEQPPFEQPIPAPEGPGYVRAMAYLDDGSSTEDLVLLNVEGAVEETRVDLVELYLTVLDGGGHPVTDLSSEELRVRENGQPQTIVRLEPVANRPVHLALVLDGSASMAERLPEVRRTAVGFLESFLQPRDRAALVLFNDKPRLLERLTNDVEALAEEIAGFTAEGNTALYDAVVFALHHLAGIRGQRAVVVITDGKDETSRFDFEQTLDYARAAGSTIYTIGIGTDLATRRHLARLASESGGRSFEVEGTADLETIYATIARELRAGYLVVYQSSASPDDTSFRRVEVDVTRPGHEVRAPRGYFP